MAKKPNSKLSIWQKNASYGGFCAICNRRVDVLTVDHIVPVSIIQMIDDTGVAVYEDEENFQLVCFPCNKMKADKLDKRNPKTTKILDKYLTTHQ